MTCLHIFTFNVPENPKQALFSDSVVNPRGRVLCTLFTFLKSFSHSYSLGSEGYRLLQTVNALSGNEMVAAKNHFCGLDILSHMFTVKTIHENAYFLSVSFKI